MRGFRHRLVWSCAALLLAGGCAAPRLSPLNYGVRHIPDVDAAVVFAATREALISEGYGIERADQAAGVITTQPIPAARRDGNVQAGGRLRSAPRMRRVVRVHVTRSADVVNVYCKVVVEEQATEALRMLQYDSRVTDSPGETAIDRDAATTASQNTVWRTVRRDKAAEQRILETVLNNTRAP